MASRKQEEPVGIQKTAQELEAFQSAMHALDIQHGDTKALKGFLAGVMVGVVAGHIDAKGANAVSNAAGKILKTVELEHKLGSRGVASLQPVALT